MSSYITTDQLKVDQNISFKSINPQDLVEWSGKIISIGKYDAVKGLADLIPYYSQCKKINKDIIYYTEATYIVVQYTQNSITALKVMALDWIEESSLQLLDADAYFYLKIFNLSPSTYANTVIDLLNANGIISKWDKSLSYQD